MFLGVPFNIASYALLTLIIARVTGYKPGDFVHTFGDYHIYEDHIEQVKEQISREPRPFPKVTVSEDLTSIDDFRAEHVELSGYDSHPPIKGSLSPVGGYVDTKWKKHFQETKEK
jgi:thymidylate synthase